MSSFYVPHGFRCAFAKGHFYSCHGIMIIDLDLETMHEEIYNMTGHVDDIKVYNDTLFVTVEKNRVTCHLMKLYNGEFVCVNNVEGIFWQFSILVCVGFGSVDTFIIVPNTEKAIVIREPDVKVDAWNRHTIHIQKGASSGFLNIKTGTIEQNPPYERITEEYDTVHTWNNMIYEYKLGGIVCNRTLRRFLKMPRMFNKDAIELIRVWLN